MKPTIIFYDTRVNDEASLSELLQDKFTMVFTEAALTADTVDLAATAEVISTHVNSQITGEIMTKMPQLRHVACRSTGYDHVDLAYTRKHDITVSTVPSYGEATVAEYAFLLLLAVSRRLMLTAHATRFGSVVPEKLTGHDLFGHTMGIIGTGRIGRHTAQIARGFGMKVVAHDLLPQPKAAAELGFEYLPLSELLEQADYISLHAPATPETHHLLSTKQFEQMKPGVFIVNTARGSLIDTEALVKALDEGIVAGAGLDVLEGEEYSQTNAQTKLLGQRPNVLITCHNAYNSAEALHRIRETTASNIQSWQSGQFKNLVTQ